MRKSEMEAWIATALEHVPKGDFCQGQFRNMLNAMFERALGPGDPEQKSVAETVDAAIDVIGCQPTFDAALRSLDWPT